MDIITNKEKIKKYQIFFEKALRHNNGKPLERIIQFPGPEDKNFYVYWSPNLNFWSASKIKDNKKGYRNLFGLTEPTGNVITSYSGDINFSLVGGNTGGRFIEDEDKVLVVHSGNIKQGTENFWNHYNGVKLLLYDIFNFAIIGTLPIDESEYLDFQRKIKSFIQEIERIKKC